MLHTPSVSMKYALRRAADAAEKAAQANDESEREIWLSVEHGWLKLASSCDLTDRIGSFLNEQALRPFEPLPPRNEMIPYKKE